MYIMATMKIIVMIFIDGDGVYSDDNAKVLNYHHRLSDTHEMPDWVSSIFLQWLPWLLRYKYWSLYLCIFISPVAALVDQVYTELCICVFVFVFLQ